MAGSFEEIEDGVLGGAVPHKGLSPVYVCVTPAVLPH